eukprot:7358287-Pyramimonas_sp.AAC.1
MRSHVQPARVLAAGDTDDANTRRPTCDPHPSHRIAVSAPILAYVAQRDSSFRSQGAQLFDPKVRGLLSCYYPRVRHPRQ